MKKKLLILLTFIISLFVCCGRVEAAKELTCVYDGGGLRLKMMIVQYQDGQIEMYSADQGEAEISNPYWEKSEDYNLHFELASSYDNNAGVLNSCPQFTSMIPISNNNKNIFFADEVQKYKFEKKNYNIKHEVVIKDISIPNFSGTYLSFDCTKDYSSQINNTEWIGKCEYSLSGQDRFYLYFNENTMIVDNKLNGRCVSNLMFTLNQLLELDYCPRIYELRLTDVDASLGTDYYLAKPKTYAGISISTEITYIDGGVKPVRPISPSEPIDDCGDLFDDNLQKKINEIMDIVKILVPILLIVFGILDFTKAIFAGKEDNMKKNQKKFFKRIIAAILVFIAPIFINLILTLANEVWDDIGADTCVEKSD